MQNMLKILSIQTLFAALMLINVAHAAEIIGSVKDSKGKPVEFAVITLIGNNINNLNSNAEMPAPIMSQENIQFSPFVLPVSVGTTVSFPNKDNLRHHVYSFSKVKRFELELYGGDEEKSVHFDKEGVVALGCNIHDQMLAFIYIVPSNNFSTSNNDGKAILKNISSGTYKLQVWHPRIKGNVQDYTKEITLSNDETVNIDFDIELKRERKRKNRGSY